MLTSVHPKLPMRHKDVTRDFYCRQLGFKEFGNNRYPNYLMLERDQIQIHFFLFEDLVPSENYGQVYLRTENIDKL